MQYRLYGLGYWQSISISISICQFFVFVCVCVCGFFCGYCFGGGGGGVGDKSIHLNTYFVSAKALVFQPLMANIFI